MIIDMHAHTTNKKLSGLHVERATIADLEKFAKEYDVTKIILMPTYFPFKGSGNPNAVIHERIKGNKLFSMFGSLDAMNNLETGIKELENLAKEKVICGIKLYPGYQDFNPSDEKIFPIYKLAEQFDLPVMYHGGVLHYCCPQERRDAGRFKCGSFCKIETLQHLAHPNAIINAIKKFPKVNFIISHLANPYFDDLRNAMKKYPNVYTDISGQFSTGNEKDNDNYKKSIVAEIEKILEIKNGIDRVIFATDFPIQSYADSIGLVKSLNLSKTDKDKIFYKNAARLLRWSA